MSIQREAGELVVLVPARMTQREIDRHVPDLVAAFLAREAARPFRQGDRELTERAQGLFARYLAPTVGPSPAFTIRWSAAQRQRWGSCIGATGEIRISERVRSLPDWVADYVLVHELAHLIESNHGPRFWRLVSGYQRAERARGYLEGLAAARRWPPDDHG